MCFSRTDEISCDFKFFIRGFVAAMTKNQINFMFSVYCRDKLYVFNISY